MEGNTVETGTGRRPKIGCVSWCFHSFAGGADPTEAIDLIGEIGFEGVDLILLARADIQEFWTLSQREYPPVAIHKVKNHLMNLHMRDIDGLMREFVHVGEGVMDFQAIADTLQAVGFSGFLSIEQDKHPGDMKATCRRYLALMKECLA